ncbi:altronate hydrolase [Burkholderia sp. OAS925]
MTETSVASASAQQPTLQGYLRSDGRKGIRNVVAVAYLVECAHHVAREIVTQFREPLDAFGDAHAAQEAPVHLIGFPGCYPNGYAEKMLERLTTHPNVGAVLFVSLGCESMNKHYLVDVVRASGRPVEVLTIQEKGGTRSTIQYGVDWVRGAREQLAAQQKVPMALSELVVGTICGGSDGTSGITANPAVGRAFDHLIDAGATCIFEETGELVGCEFHMKTRAARPELGDAIVECVAKAARYYSILGHGSFAVGNADGGLTTQEEKSLGAYAKSGASPIAGIVKPGDIPPTGGLYLLDVVPDGEPRFGFPNISDNAEIGELIACGRACDSVHDRTRFGGGLGDLAGHQGVRESRDISQSVRRHGRRRRPHSGRARHARRSGPRGVRADRGGVARRGVEIGNAGPPGIHSDVQDVRAGRARVPAVERGGAASCCCGRAAVTQRNKATKNRSEEPH